jgi:hypothetical protein
MSEENQNLTAGYKLLLEWHERFGHRNFTSIQRLMRFFPFTSQRFGAAAKFDIPRCSFVTLPKLNVIPNNLRGLPNCLNGMEPLQKSILALVTKSPATILKVTSVVLHMIHMERPHPPNM